MSETYFKAVRPDGTSFHDPDFRWLPEDGVIGDWLVEHPAPANDYSPRSGVSASRYLSVSVSPSDCTGFSWPCRLLVVEPVGPVETDDSYPNKRRGRAFRVVDEWESWQAFGPNGRQVAAFLALLPSLRREQWDAARDAAWAAARGAAWDAARGAAWGAARSAAMDAARDAAMDAARDAARDAAWGAADAALALTVRDLISAEDFATLTAPMRAAGVDFDALGVDSDGE